MTKRDTTTRPASDAAGQRRVRYGVTTAVLIAAVTASCIIAGALANRFNVRLDVTATREHALSERTGALLRAVDTPHTIVVSADFQQLDRRARQRIGDVIIEFTEANPLIRSTEIDTGTTEGRAAFAALLTDLAGQYADAIERHRAILTRAADETGAVAAGLTVISEQLRALQPLLPESAAGTDVAGQADVLLRLATELEAATTVVRNAAGNAILGVALPEGDVAQDSAMLRLEQAARAMTTVAEFADALRAETEDARLTDACQALRAEAQRIAPVAAAASDDLRRLQPLTPLLIARVLQARNAVLVVSDTDVQAIEFDALFPSSERIDATGGSEAQIRFAGEELIATAISGMNMDRPPIAVFVHGEQTRLFDDEGRPTSAALRAFRRLFDRLRLRGVDVAEWPVHFEPVRPRAADIAARVSAANTRTTAMRDRPVVWVFLAPPARRPGGSTRERLETLTRMGDSLARLIADGEPVLLNADPSDLAAFSEADPIASAVAPLGLTLDTARTVVRVIQTPQGPATAVHFTSRDANEAHPVGGAIDGLATVLPWPTPMRIGAEAGASRITPLITIPSDQRMWAESEWLGYRYAPLRDPGVPLMLSNPPTPNPDLDDVDGPWVVAAAIETPAPASDLPSRRLIVVGSPSWFGDQYTQLSEVVQNRRIWRYPGNAELFENSVFWLAHLDEVVAPSAQARDIDRIGDLSPGQLTTIRWFLIAGLPLAVLLLGALVRLLRG